MTTPAEHWDKLTTALAAEPVDTASAEGSFKALVAALSTPEVNPIVRLKTVEAIGNYGAQFEAFRESMSALVHVLSTEDDTKTVVACIDAIATLCKKAVEGKNAKGEFVVRESTDLIMQLALDPERPEAVKQAAHNKFPVLVATEFKAVVTKLLHWISDDREDDEAEYLASERSYALTRLHHLVTNKSFEKQWSDEVTNQLIKFLTLILPTITANEFNRLAGSIAKLPQVKEASCAPLIDAILTNGSKFKDTREVEMLYVVGKNIPKGISNDAFAKRLLQDVAKVNGAESVVATVTAKGIELAAHHCTDALAEEYAPKVFEAMVAATGNFTKLPANFTAFEGLAFAFAALGRKATIPFYDSLAAADVLTNMKALAEQIAEVSKKVVFAVKKKILAKSADKQEGELIGTLSSVQKILEALSANTLVSVTMSPSWQRHHHLPRVKSAISALSAGGSGTYKAGQSKQPQARSTFKGTNSKRRRN